METYIHTLSCAKTDPGLRRPHNEDACLINNTGGYFIVADGIGGAAAGEIASGLFISTASELFSPTSHRSLETTRTLIQECFLAANARILAHAVETPAHSGLGCTAEILALHTGGFVLGHIGDSRTYRLRQKTFCQLTKDHSLVQQQIDQGLIDKDKAKTHPMKNVILRAVGVNEQLSVDIVQGSVLPGDIFLLCTDGLSDMVDDQQIEEVLARANPLTEKAEILVNLANTAGGRDNVSVVLVEVRG